MTAKDDLFALREIRAQGEAADADMACSDDPETRYVESCVWSDPSWC